MDKPEFVLKNETNKILWDFKTNGSPNYGQKTSPRDNQQKKKERKKKEKRTCRWVDFVVPANHWVKI